MDSTLIYWLENVFNTKIDCDLLKNHVAVANFIIVLFKKFQLVNKTIQRSIDTASSLEHKLNILQLHLQKFGKIDEATLNCVKCGNIEYLRTILTNLYLTLAPISGYKSIKKSKKMHKKVSIIENTDEVKKGQTLADDTKFCSWRSRKTCKVHSKKIKQSMKLYKSRQKLEEKYRTMREQYNLKKNTEIQSLKKLFHQIFDIGIQLAVKSEHYRYFDTCIPHDILSEWTSLCFNGQNLYEIPLYLTPEDTQSVHFIKNNEGEIKCITNLNIQRYLCSRSSSVTTEVDKMLSSLEKMSFEPSFDINVFSIRGVIHQSNKDESGKENLAKKLKLMFECFNVELINPKAVFNNILAKLVVEDVVSNINLSQENENGTCDLINDVNEQKVEVNEFNTNKDSKPRKSVRIANETVQLDYVENKTHTHICQTPLRWTFFPYNCATAFLQMKLWTLQENQTFDQLPLSVKIEFLGRYLQDCHYLKKMKGFILLDFPSTVEEIDAFELFCTRTRQSSLLTKYSFFQLEYKNVCDTRSQIHRSIFTHYLRLKCYDEMHNGLYYDEINNEEFQAIKNFYLKVGVYHTIEYYDITEEFLSELKKILMISDNKRTKVVKNNDGFIRTQFSIDKADVELQVDLINCNGTITNEEQSSLNFDPSSENSSSFSKFLVKELIQKWICVQKDFENMISKPLVERSNIIRDSFMLQRYIEAIFKFNINKPIDDTFILENFVKTFNELNIFYRTDDGGKCYLYSLIEDLAKKLFTLIIEKETRSLAFLKTTWNDPTIIDMCKVLINSSMWLLFNEYQRLQKAVNLISELFSILIACKVSIEVPEMNCPDDIKNQSVLTSNTSIDEQKSLVDDFKPTIEIPKTDYLFQRKTVYTELMNAFQTNIDTCSQMIQQVASQIDNLSYFMQKNEEVLDKTNNEKPRGSSETSKRRKKSIKGFKKRKNTTISMESKGSSINNLISETFFINDSQNSRLKTLKNQLKMCLHEQAEITKEAIKNIQRTLQNDLKSLLFGNAELLQKIHFHIKESKEVKVGELKSLITKLSPGIENTSTLSNICTFNDKYIIIEDSPYISLTPSIESHSSNDWFLNKLCDIKFLISKFQSTNSHLCLISYHKLMDILRTSLIELYLKNSQLCSSVKTFHKALKRLKLESNDLYIVDWRNLILNLINNRTPTLTELLKMKQNFEQKAVVKNFKWVSRGNYYQIELWFECEYENVVACQLKRIYFELYKKGENSFQYETFLMGLCKSKNPLEGFQLALELFTGNYINVLYEAGEEYIKRLENQRKFKDFIKQQIKDLTRTICFQIIYRNVFPSDEISCTSLFKQDPSTYTKIKNVLNHNIKEPILQYLQMRKFQSCGCSIKEMDFVNLSTFEALKKENKYFISKPLVFYISKESFPWHNYFKRDGYDIIDACSYICDNLSYETGEFFQNKDGFLPAHKLFKDNFIQYCVSKGFTFINFSLLSE